jgi:hypothetical protein
VSDALEARALRAEIEQTRAELGHTVEELAARMDVKARARQAGRDAADKARVQLDLATRTVAHSPLLAASLAGTVAGVLALLVARTVHARKSRNFMEVAASRGGRRRNFNEVAGRLVGRRGR